MAAIQVSNSIRRLSCCFLFWALHISELTTLLLKAATIVTWRSNAHASQNELRVFYTMEAFISME